MTYENIVSIYEKEVVCFGKKYVLGQLFIDFLDLDLTEYEAGLMKIKEVLKTDNTKEMESFTKNLKIQKRFSRGYDGFAYILLNISENMPLKQKYTLHALYKLLLQIDHKYLQILDYGAISKFDSNVVLKEFDLVNLQTKYKKAMKYCLLKDDTKDTPVQRLKRYEEKITDKAELIFDISDNMVLYEVYTASTISSLLYIEFMKMIQNNVYVSVCENCGEYFIPKGNYDMKYCDRKPDKGTKSCQEIGAVNSFKHKIKTDPVYKEYEKAYKRYYAQKRKGVITQEQFDNWVKSASKLKKEAVNGNLSFDKFIKQISYI